MTLWILDTDHISLYQRGYLTVIEEVISKDPPRSCGYDYLD